MHQDGYTSSVSNDAERILEAAMRLPEDERAEVAAILADSVGDDLSEAEREAAWIAEAKRRLEAIRSGSAHAVLSEEVEAEIERRIAQLERGEVEPLEWARVEAKIRQTLARS